jgi:serine/threonine-protein kinase
LASALANEVSRLEKALARGWQVLSLLSALVAVLTALFISAPLGLVSLLFAGTLLAWFSLVLALIARGRGQATLRLLSPLVEVSVPWLFLLAVNHTQGAEYALGSWAPPLIWAALMCVSLLRLNAYVPLLMGVMAALQFGASYAWILLPALSPAALEQPLFQPRTQLVRAGTLLLGGALLALLSTGLRRAIGTAAQAVRARELFGKYRLLREVAQGGMGVVYEALYCPEGGFQRPVAVKRIHPHLATQARFVDAFRHEAELSARLLHPNVVQVLDFGRVEDTYFLAMEYVDGVTLQQVLKGLRALDERLPVPVAGHILGEVLLALEYAHTGARDAHGRLMQVIHRDLSPHNVLLSVGGQVKLSDFGIAKALGEGSAPLTGSVKGHFTHMAPEQATGGAMDQRCDVFCAGILGWEMLTGGPLFQRPTEAATLLAVLHDAVPPPTSFREELRSPPGWDGLLGAALERNLEKRLGSASEFRLGLRALMGDAPANMEAQLAALVARVKALPSDEEPRDGDTLEAIPGLEHAADSTRVERRPRGLA